MHFLKHELETKGRQTMTKITTQIQQDLEKSGVRYGVVVVFCPHTTAGITINENADPYVCHDLILGFENVFPTDNSKYLHAEGNSHAHMKSSVVGASQMLIVENGKLVLGTWQDVYFCEYDGPRRRTYYVKILQG